jgi:hypothetical protein
VSEFIIIICPYGVDEKKPCHRFASFESHPLSQIFISTVPKMKGGSEFIEAPSPNEFLLTQWLIMFGWLGE